MFEGDGASQHLNLLAFYASLACSGAAVCVRQLTEVAEKVEVAEGAEVVDTC